MRGIQAVAVVVGFASSVLSERAVFIYVDKKVVISAFVRSILFLTLSVLNVLQKQWYVSLHLLGLYKERIFTCIMALSLERSLALRLISSFGGRTRQLIIVLAQARLHVTPSSIVRHEVHRSPNSDK